MIIAIIVLILTVFLIKFFFGKNLQTFNSQWQKSFSNFNFSALEFYELVTKELQSKAIDGIKMGNITLRENTILSAKRVYLKIEWKDLEYNVCCAPFVDATFFSSWLLTKNSFFQIVILKIPFVGLWLFNKIYPSTFFKHDTTSIFTMYVHQVLLDVIEEVTKETGVRMSEQEKKPIMKSVFER